MVECADVGQKVMVKEEEEEGAMEGEKGRKKGEETIFANC